MKLFIAAVLLLVAAPAAAQLNIPPASVDLTPYAKASDLVAAVPPVCSSSPSPDTVGGTVGVAAPCIPRSDNARSTQVMPSQAVTQADGTFSGTWPGTFTSAPTTAFASAKTAVDPYSCQVAVATTTTYSGKCWKTTQVLTLPTSAVALLGLQLTSAAAAGAGITVMVAGRQ